MSLRRQAAHAVLCILFCCPLFAQQTAETAIQSATEAARNGDLSTARRLLTEARQAYPADPRIPVELAGVAFLEKHYSEAEHLLRLSKKLGATDPYVDEFLGTVMLLLERPEAALAAWNRQNQPVLAAGPQPTGLEGILRPGLAADALRFSPGSVLHTSAYLRAQRTLDLLDICGTHAIALEPADDESYRATVRCVQRPVFGQSLPGSAVMLARGIGYQALHLELPVAKQRAATARSLLRWDPRKRRAWAEYAMPLAGRAAWRILAWGDARHEYWQMLQPQTDNVQQAFLLRRWEAGVGVGAVLHPRITWENRVSLANRAFPIAFHEPPIPERLHSGASVRYGHSIDADILRLPAQRITAIAHGDASWEQYLRSGENVYRTIASFDTEWLPRASGNDLRVNLSFHTGALHGNAPIAEQFNVGLERDGAVPLRAHIGTRDGRKGNALYGDRYAVANLSVEQSVLRAGVLRLAVAPFLDAGWVRDRAGIYGARTMRFDAGVQLLAETPTGTRFRLSYGWDLRRGQSAFYAWSEPFPILR